MLVLGRKVGEMISIDKTIRVKVIAIHEGQVKLGIEAPEEVRIVRTELYDQVVQQNKQAVKVSKASVKNAAAVISKEQTRTVQHEE